MKSTHKPLLIAWAVGILIVAVVVLYFTLGPGGATKGTPLIPSQIPLPAILGLIMIAFLAESIDSSLGMGYGTTLTPLLIAVGFAPHAIVPAVLFSELTTGILAGLLHHNQGNVNLSRGSRHYRIMWTLAACSIVGAVLATLLLIRLSALYVKLYVGVLVVGIGIFVLLSPQFAARFSYKRIIGLGLLASFNKGMSGGGYGPVTTGGQILAGVDSKAAVGITSVAEGLTCAVALITLYLTGGSINWALATPLTCGAVLSVPLAVFVVKVLPAKYIQRGIGLACLFLGLLTLAKLLR